VSENDDCHCAGTTKVAVKGHGKENLKRKALRCHWGKVRGCGHDTLGQSILSMGSSNREGLIMDSQ